MGKLGIMFNEIHFPELQAAYMAGDRGINSLRQQLGISPSADMSPDRIREIAAEKLGYVAKGTEVKPTSSQVQEEEGKPQTSQEFFKQWESIDKR